LNVRSLVRPAVPWVRHITRLAGAYGSTSLHVEETKTGVVCDCAC